MRVIVGALVSLVLAFAVFAWLRWPREPSYHGAPLSQWLVQFNMLPANQPAPAVEEAIRAMGAESVPFLLAHIWADESARVSDARKWLNRKFTQQYRSRIDLCAPSWRALGILGSAGTSAIPELVRHASDGPFQGRAMIGLAVLGTNSIPALISLCGHTNAEVRVDAAFVLAKTRVGMRGVERFNATSPFSNQPMLAYNIGTGADDIMPLIAHLKHSEAAVRRATVEALGSLPEIGVNALTALKEVENDPDPAVADASRRVLSQRLQTDLNRVQ